MPSSAFITVRNLKVTSTQGTNFLVRALCQVIYDSNLMMHSPRLWLNAAPLPDNIYSRARTDKRSGANTSGTPITLSRAINVPYLYLPKGSPEHGERIWGQTTQPSALAHPIYLSVASNSNSNFTQPSKLNVSVKHRVPDKPFVSAATATPRGR